MAEETITPEKINDAITALRESKDKSDSEFKDMADKTQKILDEQEKQNQELVSKFSQEQKKVIEIQEVLDKIDEEKKTAVKENKENTAEFVKRIENLEKEIINLEDKGKEKENYKDTAEFKALENFCRYGKSEMDANEVKLLRTDDATQGGYLTMSEMDNMVLKNITEYSPVRQVCRVRTTGSKTLEIPIRTGIPAASYEGEAADGDLSNSTYGLEVLTAYRLTTTIPYTRDMLMDSEFDLENEIMVDVSESFAQREGNRFVLGTGAKQPSGFQVDANLRTNRTSAGGGASGVIEADDLILLSGQLKVGYNPYYGFNRRSLATFRTYAGSDGQYLWQSGLGGGAPNTIAGYPYILLEDMPDIASDSYSIVFADFMKGYTVIDRTGLEIIRDEVTRKRAAIIELTFHRYNTGQVVLDEAFQLLQTPT